MEIISSFHYDRYFDTVWLQEKVTSGRTITLCIAIVPVGDKELGPEWYPALIM